MKDFPATLARGEDDELGFRKIMLGLGMTDEKITELGARLYRAWSTTPNLTLDMLTQIDNQVLVVDAGADQFIDRQHFLDMANTLQNATWLTLPEMTHNPMPFAEEMATASARMADAAQ